MTATIATTTACTICEDNGYLAIYEFDLKRAVIQSCDGCGGPENDDPRAVRDFEVQLALNVPYALKAQRQLYW